ncbi:neuronal acetylcholine receptor subunit alpha-3 isoform X2 [Patella vulgata]|uniref:neuronal acetylcholine receptor subunit alpha-3 isoform X2 n=1 Tax=Patella vulgata TaxID=6465 RepID=UPI0021806D7D|nr:neuronal acetylcholine receptor subunit alpha-3 isoform X2 [Patella vulgata]
MMRVLQFFCFLTLFTSGSASAAHFIGNETQLRTDLLITNSYSKDVRPDEKVEISIRFNVLTLNELNIKTQTLDITGWLTAKWNDSRLSWTPASYGGINYMFGTDSSFWRPLLFVDNSIGSVSMMTDSAVLMRAKYTGEVIWEPPAIYTTHCESIITYYPFDVQNCMVEIVSWAYTIDEVNLTHMETHINFEDYRVNGEWTLVSSHLESNQLVDGHEIFSQLEFVMKFRRRPTFYIFNIILPIMLLSFLSVIGFVLPADSGEKVGYNLTNLLAYAVLLTLISDNMPSTSHHISVLGVYLTLILFVGALSVILAVVSLYLHHQPPIKSIPRWIQLVVLGFMHKLTSYDIKNERGEGGKSSKGKASGKDKVAPLDDQTRIMTPSKEATPTVSSRMEKTTEKGSQPDYSEYSWVDMSKIFDAFFFRFFLVLVVLVTIICMLVLVAGGALS